MEALPSRALFGGALRAAFPARFQDVSAAHDVPDNQEVFVDGARDESVIVELLELKRDVDDAAAAEWFLEDLATEQEATVAGTGLEASGPLLAEHVPLMDPAIAKSMAVGTLAISKYKQGPKASNIVKCHVAVLRLKNVNTDVLVTVYEPLHISGRSEVAQTVGAGATTSASAAGCLPASEGYGRFPRTASDQIKAPFRRRGRHYTKRQGHHMNGLIAYVVDEAIDAKLQDLVYMLTKHSKSI
eukprot:SM000131S26719  [mRNA]  locus=s131:95162:100074:- [translate_table: standard]